MAFDLVCLETSEYITCVKVMNFAHIKNKLKIKHKIRD